jgi:mevalonate kinase
VFFGDYSLIHGWPAVALAVNPRAKCSAQVSGKFTVNGEDLDQRKHPLVREVVLQGWSDVDQPVSINVESEIPRGAGLGHHSAMAVSCLAALSMLHDHMILDDIAKRAFQVELAVLGDASPLRTSASTYGSGILVTGEKRENLLFEYSNGKKKWYVHSCCAPDMCLVLGITGVTAQTGHIGKVKRFYERNAFARDIMKEIGQLALDGDGALKNGDLEKIGKLMSQTQKMLVTLGASHPNLDKLLKAVERHSYGAKQIGAGGGGNIVALTDRPDKVIEAIKSAGGDARVIEVEREGIKLED